MPYHPGRQTGLVFLLPPHLLGKGDRPIKNLLPITIPQREHPPHLGKPGLTQRTPVPLFGAFLQGQTQQILAAGLSFTILLLVIALLLGIAAVFVTLSARAAASATAKRPKES